ncbi:MAG TPA: YeeE/YedE family protein [Methylovirgula sp.]
MAQIFLSLLCGLLFGSGLILSQMSNPAKVLNFLDIGGIASGTWDPSLAFVMLGAVSVAAIGFLLGRRRKAPVLADAFQAPQKTRVDAALILGAATFGIGWGLVGFCPGPALTALGFGRSEPIIFVAAMIAGMLLFNVYAAKTIKDTKV